MAATLMHNFGGAGGVMTSVDRFKLSADLNCVLKKDLSSDQRHGLEKLGIYSTGNDDIILDKGFNEALLGQLTKELKTVVDDDKADVQPSSEDDDHAAKRALRAAILKARFAETIAKANGGKSEPRKANQKTQSLERGQRQEAKIKPSTTKEELKQEDELKRQRNKEREDARKALELVERNVQVEDNFKVMKEFEMLISQSSVCYTDCGYGPEMALRERKSGKVLHPLQKLGLHIKKEFLADDNDCEEHQTGRWKKRKY